MLANASILYYLYSMKTHATNDFNYNSFDLLMRAFLQMNHVLVDEWDNCTAEELTHDIHSLCVKGSRLCNMIDTDLVLQQQDLTHSRDEKNKSYFLELGDLIMPLVRLITRDLLESQDGKTMDKPSAKDSQMDLDSLLPKLGEWVLPNAPDNAKTRETFTLLPLIINAFKEEMEYNPIFDEPWQLQIVNAFKEFAILCLLTFHFRQLVQMTNKDVSKEQAGHLLTKKVQAFCDTEKGQEEMRHFIAVIKYENNGNSPTVETLDAERKQLVKLLPKIFQTCFMEHIDDINELATSIMAINPAPNAEELEDLYPVIAKYQWISEKMYESTHPTDSKSEIYNKVLHTSLNGKPVNMNRLYTVIKKMVGKIEKKNHWFCIYSVLKYRNYIKDPVATHFAQQMQQADWFPHLPEHLRFTGETLTEYNGYLNDNTYPTWNKERYEIFRLSKGKKKWSPSLWLKFQRLCYELDECFTQ